MPRKKQLKVSGSDILDFSVQIKSEHEVDLKITTNDDVYIYDIRKDTREPDINKIKDHIENSLSEVKNDFLRVEISEYPERSYLFFIVQGKNQVQYTGYRL